MRNLYFVLGIASILTSCKTPETDGKSERTSVKRIEITPFIQTTVVLRDTAMVKNVFASNDSGRVSMYKYNSDHETHLSYLNHDQFMVIKRAAMEMMHDPGTLIYADVFAPPMTKDDIAARLVMCDSVVESNFDASGKEILIKRWLCDSTSIPTSINKIRFYEAWYFNPGTRMIEKDLLGYSLWQYDEYKRGYRDLFTVFKDKEALKVAQNKWSW